MPPFSVVVSTRECLPFLSCPSGSIGHPCVFYRGTITSSGFPLITCGNDSGGGACGNDSGGGACPSASLFRYPWQNSLALQVSGYSLANRREARKLGLLLSGKSSEAERERLEPLERNERVCGECPHTNAHPAPCNS